MDATAREHLRAIFEAGLAAVDPGEAVRRHLRVDGRFLVADDVEIDLARTGRINVVGAGKASAVMCEALEELLGDRITDGWINVKTGHGRDLRRIHVHEAGHPVPDEAGVRGTREILRRVQGLREDDLVLCCLSGGGSALMTLPCEPLTLSDARDLNEALLRCGAPIGDMNAVRKHFSRVKGGRLAEAAQPARVVSLLLSDVIGDRLDVIASGPTAPDESTWSRVQEVVGRYGIEKELPEAVLSLLEAGLRNDVPETPKEGDPLFERVTNLVIASNRVAVEAAAGKAEALGYRPHIVTTTLEGEARDAVADMVQLARRVREQSDPVAPPACLIAGGETTVTVTGDGRGGRNQEFALAAAGCIEGLSGISVLAAGTDGTDGPTDAAGAFADDRTAERARIEGLDPIEFLDRNDSYTFFDSLGDLLKTGPTGTNVMDLYLFLVEKPSEGGAP